MKWDPDVVLLCWAVAFAVALIAILWYVAERSADDEDDE